MVFSLLLFGLGLFISANTASAHPVGVTSVMKKASHFKYSHRYHTAREIEKYKCGDCWAMSAYLYNHMKTNGMKVRIIQYRTKYSSRHRSVQYHWDGRWVNVPYRTYFHTYMFNNTQSYGTVIACNL